MASQHALLNSLGFLIPEQSEPVKFYLVGLLNSFIWEYRARQLAKNNNVNQFVIGNLPAPRLAESDPRFRSIVTLVQQVMGVGRGRAELRARLDAEIARLFGLSTDELETVMANFPKVALKAKRAVVDAFRELSSAAG